MAYQSIVRCPDGNATVKIISSTSIVNGSILLVPANTVAIVCINGIESEPYYPGRHEIDTGVDPFFVRFRNIMTQGDPGITCQIFFVNIVQELCEQGGTGNMIFEEHRFKISMSAKAAFTMRYVITNPKKFISKLVGMHNNSFESEDIQPAITSMILPAIKEAVISSVSNGTIHNIQNNLTGVGNDAYSRLSGELLNYGISLKAIAITAINIPDSDLRRLNELEERNARGRLNTDLEVDNIERVYGNVNNRTMAELLTGSVRGPANPMAGRNGVGGMAGAMTALPWQIAMAKMAMDQMNGSMPNPLNNTSGAGNTSTSVTATQTNSNAQGDSRRVPPPIPVRPKLCPNCKKALDASDMFCKYCGGRL